MASKSQNLSIHSLSSFLIREQHFFNFWLAISAVARIKAESKRVMASWERILTSGECRQLSCLYTANRIGVVIVTRVACASIADRRPRHFAHLSRLSVTKDADKSMSVHTAWICRFQCCNQVLLFPLLSLSKMIFV